MIYIENIKSMKEYFNETGEEYSTLKQKLIFKIRNFFRKIYIKEIEKEKYKLIICLENSSYDLNTKMIKKIIKTIKKLNEKNIVLSIELEENEKFKNLLYSQNFDILEGRELFKFLVPMCVEKICAITKNNIENQDISFLVSKPDLEFIFMLTKMSQKCRVINILTNNINEFKDIETEIYERQGIIINISNNFKKSMRNSNFVINYNFPLEKLNMCNFPRYGVILNIEQIIKIYSIKFKGININDYEIKINSSDKDYIKKLKKFNLNKVYESILYEKIQEKKFEDIESEIEKDKIKIKALKGNNGIISKREFLSISKEKELIKKDRNR